MKPKKVLISILSWFFVYVFLITVLIFWNKMPGTLQLGLSVGVMVFLFSGALIAGVVAFFSRKPKSTRLPTSVK